MATSALHTQYIISVNEVKFNCCRYNEVSVFHEADQFIEFIMVYNRMK